MTDSLHYDVALSFAGEDRPYVSRVAAALEANGIRVFYDEYEKVTLWGKDLYVHLREVYKTAAEYTVMFISHHYKKKLWTNHERESAQARAFQEGREYILPVKFDDTDIPGLLPTTGYLDLRSIEPEELAQFIAQKLGREPTRKERVIDRESVRALLVKVQARTAPLSECIAEALGLADAWHLEDLAEFCTNELVGYPPVAAEEEGLSRTHRHMQMFCVPGGINLGALGARGMSIFQYIDSHPDQFAEKTHLENQSISLLESRRTPNEQGSWTMTLRVSDFNPSAEKGDMPVTCYSRPDAYQRIIEAVRTQLTKKLTNLLAGAQPQSGD